MIGREQKKIFVNCFNFLGGGFQKENLREAAISANVQTAEATPSDSLFEDVLRVHPPVELGQFDGEDDAGQEKDTAASQTEPERVLKHITRGTGFSLLFTLPLVKHLASQNFFSALFGMHLSSTTLIKAEE